MRAPLSSMLLLVLGGCVSLLPPPSVEVYNGLSKTVDTLGEMRAAAALPGADASYPAMRPFYARAYAGLDTAQTVMRNRVEGSRGKPFARTAKLSDRTVANCRGAIDLLRSKNEGAALIAADFATFQVVNTCTVAKMIEGDLKRGN